MVGGWQLLRQPGGQRRLQLRQGGTFPLPRVAALLPVERQPPCRTMHSGARISIRLHPLRLLLVTLLMLPTVYEKDSL